MPGPPPKNAKVRQRRNRSATSAVLPAGKTRVRIPALPGRGSREWNVRTVAWWRDVWHSPMAVEFVEADVHALFRLAVLVDMFWTEPTKELAAEIRLEQQAFGLTPIDRRRLPWSIEEQEERARRAPASQQQQTAREPEVSVEIEDPRRLLKLVG